MASIVRARRGVALPAVALSLIAAFSSAAASEPAAGAGAGAETALRLDQIALPPGFEISLFARAEGARSMVYGDDGTLFVGTGGFSDPDPQGRVWAIRDPDRDGIADEVTAVASGLFNPNGVAFHDGDLYVAEINRILKFPAIESSLDAPPPPVVVFDQLPDDIWHGWKYISFGPDGKLYVPVGAPCNVCDESLPYSALHRMNPDGSGFEVVAEGVRNTVGFDWHPETGQLWFTDNGRDNLGPIPPDELNRLERVGDHFGFPFCHGAGLKDPQYGPASCAPYTGPVVELGAHVASLGMTFYDGEQFPAELRHQIFIAEHGSWNSPEYVGYKVSLVKATAGGDYRYEDFATGWLNADGESRWGRPVDVLVAPDGALMVSDDMAGAIYRIRYTGGDDAAGDDTGAHGGFIIDDDRNYWDADVGLGNGSTISAADAQLFRVYYGALGRLPDPGGFAWWANEIAQGRRDLNSMAAGFLHSPEFRSLVDADGDGELAHDEVLTHMYVTVFGREPDADGYAWWMEELASGRRTLVDLLVRMTQSNEYVELTLQALAAYLPSGSSAPAEQGSGAADGDSGDAAVAATAADYYRENVAAPVVAGRCITCHVEGGIAPGAGARLVFAPEGTPDRNPRNLDAIAEFVDGVGDSGELILTKIRGVGHGGGAVFSASSAEYQAVAKLVSLLDAGGTGGDVDDDNGDGTGPPAPDTGSGFWSGVTLASRESTLRRASLILAGRLPTPAEKDRARGSDASLRETVLELMQGDGFHDFLIRAANDRLNTDGFMNGLSLEPSDLHAGRNYPVGLNAWYREPPVSEAGQLEQERLQQGFRYGLVRAPLELIAHVVENDRPYTEILTADYTMVNPQSAFVFNSDTTFGADADRRVFKVGKNRGQVVEDDQYVNHYAFGVGTQIPAHSGFVDYPHAGILNEPAWLARYPSTETNRNRARSRWTYYHFLDVDIERSAPRTTDPEALADRDNPTMNNPACTVCHERLDPVAGAYQNYGDDGIWRSAWGGRDSLPETYKYPEWFDDEAGPSLYQEGDTWYRDMRSPGFENSGTPPRDYSLQWLARQIVDDPRFATAAVAFWWPALMGEAMLEAPEVLGDADAGQQLAAFEAQQVTADEIADDFINSGYRLKELLADLVLTPWFRAQSLLGASPGERRVELAAAGVDRLLTPEELENKTAALLGEAWDERDAEWKLDGVYSALGDRFNIYYGGIDSVGIKERATGMTALMANVAERQALELACSAVALDFLRPPGERRLFNLVTSGTTPLSEAEKITDVVIGGFARRASYALTTPLAAGSKQIALSFNNDAFNETTREDRNLHIDAVEIIRNGTLLRRIEGEEFGRQPGFSITSGVDDDGNAWQAGSVQWEEVQPGSWEEAAWILWSNGTVTFDVALPSDGTYTVRVIAYGSDVGDGVMPRMTVAVNGTSPAEATRGSLAVREQVQALYARMLGDELPGDNPEIQAVYDLLVETWLDRRQQPDNQRAWNWPETTCWIPRELSDEEWSALANDPAQMKYSWTSVIHYLMTHFDYLHE